MVTIYTITYNEEYLISFFVTHYRKMFPDCNIIVYDNESTDNTTKIAKEIGCEVITYNSNNLLSDKKYLEIKNNVWKQSKTSWVIVCDCDELLFVNEEQLKYEELNGTSIFKPQGYSIVNYNPKTSLSEMNMGFRDVNFDKTVLFDKTKINEINFGAGSHKSSPESTTTSKIKYSKETYKLIHYKYLYPKYTIDRYKLFSSRLSPENREKGWGVHYTYSENKITEFYNNKLNSLIKIL